MQLWGGKNKKIKKIGQRGNHGGKVLTTRQNNTLGSMENLQSNPTLNNLENTHLTPEFVIKKSIFIGLAKRSNVNSILFAIQTACFCLCKRSRGGGLSF